MRIVWFPFAKIAWAEILVSNATAFKEFDLYDLMSSLLFSYEGGFDIISFSHACSQHARRAIFCLYSAVNWQFLSLNDFAGTSLDLFIIGHYDLILTLIVWNAVGR